MTERFLKFPLFHLPNEEIQSRKIQNNIHNFEFSYSGFSLSQDKRVRISKLFMSFFTLFFYITWLLHNLFFICNYEIISHETPKIHFYNNFQKQKLYMARRTQNQKDPYLKNKVFSEHKFKKNKVFSEHKSSEMSIVKCNPVYLCLKCIAYYNALFICSKKTFLKHIYV